MNRRVFGLGGISAVLGGFFGIKTVAKANDVETTQQVVVRPVEHKNFPNRSFTDEDGNYFAVEELARTFDTTDYILKCYPRDAFLRLTTPANQRGPEQAFEQAIYVVKEYSGLFASVVGEDRIHQRIDKEFKIFIKEFYKFKSRGYTDLDKLTKRVKSVR